LSQVRSGSTPSSGAGPPTTGRWCPAKRSRSWMLTYGGSPTSGPNMVMRTSRSAGSSPGTSARSTGPGETAGCSATVTAAPTSLSSPGPASSDTGWSRAECLRTILPSPNTGQTDGDEGHPPPMDTLSLRLLKAQAGRCPECGDLLLHADQPPQNPTQWEQWVRATAQALRKQSLHYRTRDGSGETSSLRLIHTRCRGRPRAVTGTGPATSARPRNLRACLSRMRGNVHVRF